MSQRLNVVKWSPPHNIERIKMAEKLLQQGRQDGRPQAFFGDSRLFRP